MSKLVGTKPYQVPTNADLGTMAYQDHTNIRAEKAVIGIGPGGYIGDEMLAIRSGTIGKDYIRGYNSIGINNVLIGNLSSDDAYLSLYDDTGVQTFLHRTDSGTKTELRGHMSMLDGNIKFASGQGIDFSATGNSSGTTTSEILDDYEEGYFNYSIPCSSSGSFNVRTTYASGYYTKVGRLVTIHIRYETQGRSSPSGDIEIDGLPFTILSTAPSGGNASYTVPILLRGASSSSFEWDFSFHLGLIPGTTKGKFYGQGEGSSHSYRALQPGDIPSNFEGSIVATYLTT